MPAFVLQTSSACSVEPSASLIVTGPRSCFVTFPVETGFELTRRRAESGRVLGVVLSVLEDGGLAECGVLAGDTGVSDSSCA